ncbi:MAG TPA: hypothetical protein VFF40_03815 [Acidimicrobiia bacterium]|nr:hypothetical protein [Acidimicrobiia bacterium]
MGKRRRAREREALEQIAREAAQQAARDVASSTVDRAELTETLRAQLGALAEGQAGRDTDLVRALDRVAESYERVANRLADERRVQVLLAEALVRIEQRLTSLDPPSRGPELPRGPRVVGGSIAPPKDPPRLDR